MLSLRLAVESTVLMLAITCGGSDSPSSPSPSPMPSPMPTPRSPSSTVAIPVGAASPVAWFLLRPGRSREPAPVETAPSAPSAANKAQSADPGNAEAHRVARAVADMRREVDEAADALEEVRAQGKCEKAVASPTPTFEPTPRPALPTSAPAPPVNTDDADIRRVIQGLASTLESGDSTLCEQLQLSSGDEQRLRHWLVRARPRIVADILKVYVEGNHAAARVAWTMTVPGQRLLASIRRYGLAKGPAGWYIQRVN